MTPDQINVVKYARTSSRYKVPRIFWDTKEVIGGYDIGLEYCLSRTEEL